ncbi:LAMI_0C06436g1_1 [Lachancea mirantina]|uniref:Condensin complex subunit 1 n=1 Tax=Lachancea mirantina TaxID=1230905 RepID=A0A1G4J3I3_9SACH|nr:LAMI_0C06436g1_1 [Lachancea mirantina]
MQPFDLPQQLARFQTTEKSLFPAVEDPVQELYTFIDWLATNPEEIDADEETLEGLIDLVHTFPQLPANVQTQLSYLVGTSAGNIAQDINTNLSGSAANDEILTLQSHWKQVLEIYGYLIHVLLYYLQQDVARAANQSSTSSGSALSGGRRQVSEATLELFKRSCNQIETLLDNIVKIVDINLSRLFLTTPEKTSFINLFTRPLYILIETEQVLKVQSIKFFIIRIIGTVVKRHGQISSTQNAIMSSLTYYMHLTNFIAELLKVVNDDLDFPQLTEEVLRDLSNKEFNSKDSTGPKVVSNFLIKLSEVIPRTVLRQMTLIVRLLNNSSFTLRCAVVEVCGNIVIGISSKTEDLDHHRQQIEVLLELLEERFADSNPYVRTKAIQSCVKICDLKAGFNRHRIILVKLATRSLQDRSSLVRKNAVKLLSKLLLTHRFTALHGSQLTLSQWKERLAEASQLLSNLTNTMTENSETSSPNEKQTDEVLHKNVDNQDEYANLEDSSAMNRAKLTVKYYEDAIEFIKIVYQATDQCAQLLLSRNKTEVMEVMDFLVLTDAYGIESSFSGIRKMLHLVWMKGSNEEGTSIATHLVSCYYELFLKPAQEMNSAQHAAYVAKNLLQLTQGASIADLASLEKLLGLIYAAGHIKNDSITFLWSIYNSAAEESPSFTTDQIHGSIIILGMLSMANSEIAIRGLDSLLKIGLGVPGKQDLVLSKYTCVALQRIKSGGRQVMTSEKLNKTIEQLFAKIVDYTKDPYYYPTCEEAINAIFELSAEADIVATELIREKTMMTFGRKEEDQESSVVHSRVVSLAQLLFVVGKVAIKTLVYLESSEAQFKKNKVLGESKKSSALRSEQAKDAEENNVELEMIGGTNEDDFSDAISFIKENELLFGEHSLLARFGPLVEEIVSNNTKFTDPTLQRMAGLCLAEFMCVSSKFCEKNLPLLITVMEKSEDPIIRSNAVLGLGDMAVCFNNLVDENTEYLYKRLHDASLTVQKTCLMTVTFLILAGQVKVKGQLGQMAKCLENADQGISDMCKLFFTELATKDNAIYNGFIDIFSSLSNDKELEKGKFKRIMKYLLSFIEKERHQKQLSEKLLTRIQKAETQKQWDDIALVLNTLPNKSDQATEILNKGFKMVLARK